MPLTKRLRLPERLLHLVRVKVRARVRVRDRVRVRVRVVMALNLQRELARVIMYADALAVAEVQKRLREQRR